MHILTFLTLCLVLAAIAIAFFFWMTEGGGTVEKIQAKIDQVRTALKPAEVVLVKGYKAVAQWIHKRRASANK
ncbi:MAG: hypothetical protein V4812_23195 [Pseudomonadota bacterium]